MGIENNTPFYLSTKSIHKVALNQLRQNDPVLYDQVQDYEPAFLRFVVNRIVEGIKRQETVVDDDLQLWEMTTHVIHSTIGTLADSFMEQVAHIIQAITPIMEEDTCPICIGTDCTAQLSCCGKGIHPHCFAAYVKSGYTRCALCRRSFQL